MQFSCPLHVLRGVVISLNHSTSELCLLKLHILFCAFHLQLLQLPNMYAVLCCSSKVASFKRLHLLHVWISNVCALSHCELERARVNQVEVERFLREAARFFCTNHRLPHHLYCSSDDLTHLKLFLFLFVFWEINQASDESSLKGKFGLQPESLDGPQASAERRQSSSQRP